MLDLVIVVGEGHGLWSTLASIPSFSDIVPFDRVEDARMFLKAFRLMLTAVPGGVPPTRINVLCLDDVTKCFPFADVGSEIFEPVIMLTTIVVENGRTLDEFVSSISRGLRFVKSIVLAFEGFEPLYNARKLVKYLAQQYSVAIATSFDDIEEDLELAVELCRKLGTKLLLVGGENAVEKLVEHGFSVDTFCISRWFLYNILAVRSSPSNVPTYLAIPNEMSRFVVVARSGLYIASPQTINVLDTSTLSEIVEQTLRKDGDALEVLNRIEPVLLLRVGDTYVSREDIELLKTIDEMKSVRAVMKKMGLSYVALRKRIVELEKGFGVKLVVSKRGGVDRGHTELTPVGKKILEYLDHVYTILAESIKRATALSYLSTCRELDFP